MAGEREREREKERERGEQQCAVCVVVRLARFEQRSVYVVSAMLVRLPLSV